MTTSHPPSSKFSTFGNSITNECHVSNSIFPIEIKLSLFLRFFALGRTPTNSQIFFTTFRWKFKSVKQLEKEQAMTDESPWKPNSNWSPLHSPLGWEFKGLICTLAPKWERSGYGQLSIIFKTQACTQRHTLRILPIPHNEKSTQGKVLLCIPLSYFMITWLFA